MDDAGDDGGIALYRQRVTERFAALKRLTRPDEVFASRLPVTRGDGFLLPLCERYAGDAALIATLARWRAANAHVYPTQFPVTLEGTASWLRTKVLDVEDRITFLVFTVSGHLIGHGGFADALNDVGEMRLDNVMRGVQDAAPGLMSDAVQNMLDWAEAQIGPRIIWAKVFSDNHRIIRFLQRMGFRDQNLTPLRRHRFGERIEYRPLTPADRAPPDKYHLRLIYSP